MRKFTILNSTCILTTWSVSPIHIYAIWNDPIITRVLLSFCSFFNTSPLYYLRTWHRLNNHVKEIRNQEIWNSGQCEFSHVNTPLDSVFVISQINVSVSVISLGLGSADNTYLSRPCLFLISQKPHAIIFFYKRIISDRKITSVVKVCVCALKVLFVPWEFLFVPRGFVFALTPMGHCRKPAHTQ